jgi:IS5 family transposase
MHAVLCATGYNLRWLLRAMIRLRLMAFYLRPLLLALRSAVSGTERRGRAYYAPTYTFQAV